MLDRLVGERSGNGSTCRRVRFMKNMSKGVRLHSDHSGLGSAEIAGHRLDKESASRNMSTAGSSTSNRACDIKSSSQTLLQHFGDQSPDYIQVDVLDSLQPDVRQRLHAMEPESSWPENRTQAAYNAIYLVMPDAYLRKALLNHSATAHCIKDSKLCPRFDQTAKGITMIVHGTACTAWSAAGKQQGSCHPSVLPWCCFVFYVLTHEPTIAIHDITELHPEEYVALHFSEKYEICSLHISPFQLGLPSLQPRRYPILVNNSKAVMVGSEQEFFDLLGTHPVVQPEALCLADSAMLMERFSKPQPAPHPDGQRGATSIG